MTTSPTFVAEFADGEITRITCHCAPDKLDPAQGVRMSIGAYEIRSRRCAREANRKTNTEVVVPKILAGRFESVDGEVLVEYSSECLAEIMKRQ
jgi:hypothetical protein